MSIASTLLAAIAALAASNTVAQELRVCASAMLRR